MEKQKAASRQPFALYKGVLITSSRYRYGYAQSKRLNL